MDPDSKTTLAGLIRTRRIAALGTLRKGEPMVTMVMFVPAADFSEFYIHTSRLAMHTQNILKHPEVSLMICESEQEGEDPQTLARVSIAGTATMVAVTHEHYDLAKRLYLEKYPAASFNFQLGDFAIYAIRTRSARYVAGFGRIFNLTTADLQDAA
jgi:putative heme iron utilization protein